MESRRKDMIAAMLEAKVWHSRAPTPTRVLYSPILRAGRGTSSLKSRQH